jgi:hypothetical protein
MGETSNGSMVPDRAGSRRGIRSVGAAVCSTALLYTVDSTV